MTEQTPVPESAEDGNLFQMMVEGMAHMDILHHLDGWFGHWWNRPFWKAEKPLVVFLENLTWQGHKRFAIPRDGDVSGYEAEVFLRNHGVYVWGRGFDSDSLYFNVKKEQASWAEYLMDREGITTVNTPVDPRNRTWAERHDGAPPGWGSNKKTMGDAIIGIFASGPKAAMRHHPRGREWPTAPAKHSRKTARKPSRRRQTQTKKQTKKQTPSLRIASARPGRFRIPGRRPARPRRVGGQSHRK